ncbi:MAG: ClbS/DfsB family four-helix bundle protein, partial [Anaerolineaceae bacterium]|nr:ClbS/DfsB family four-helix bundle protein [Anaerolineaceae bacterium]
EDLQEDTSNPPRDKAELLARIQREWDALGQAYAGLSDEQMSVPDTGGRSIKDNLAHLTAWESFMRLAYLRGRPTDEAMGIDAVTLNHADEDGINAILFEHNKDRSVADILAELDQSHQAVLADLAGMSFEEIMRQLDPQDPKRRPLINWIIGNTYEHYQEHRASIEKLARR